MKLKTYSRGTEVLSAVFLLFAACFSLYNNYLWSLFRGAPLRSLFRMQPPMTTVSGLLFILGLVLLASRLFAGKRDILAVAAVGLIVLCDLLPFFGMPSVLRMRNPVMILSYILPLASSALLLVMTCSAVLKKPALPLEKLRIVPFLIALVSLALSIYVTTRLQGFSVGDMLLRGTLVGWILNLLPFALTPNWLIGDMVRERNDAAASAADKNKQVEFYRDLMNKGAITPEEFEEKRRRIEGE